MPESPKIIILHGTGGNPGINWLPWLARELRQRSFPVLVPQLPIGESQTLKNWRAAFAQQVGPITSEMILVGHSMGAGMILRLLEQAQTPVQASFLVAGWTGLLDNPDFDPLIESFFVDPFDWALLRKNAGTATMYHCDDDPYVPLRMGQKLADDLGAELKLIPGGGHLNAESGYLEFKMLLSDILQKLPSFAN